jgi:hypothetical protein
MRFKSSRAHFVTSYLIVCSYSRRKQSDLCQEKNCLEVMLSKAVVGNKKCQKKSTIARNDSDCVIFFLESGQQ